MKGLIIKDFYLIKKHCMMLFAVSIIFLLISLFTLQSTYFLYYSVAMISIIPISIMAYDDGYKWNRYEIITPVSRKNIVSEKYILLLLLILPFVLAEGILFGILLKLNVMHIFSLLSLTLLCATISPIIIFPVIFRFGYIKGKIINMIIIAILAVFITFINMKNISGSTLIEGTFTPQKYTFIFSVITALLLAVSWLISIKFYSKREF